MSFNVALSGIAAAQTDLDSTANNIANVGTDGFKESRAEFDSVYASSLFSIVKQRLVMVRRWLLLHNSFIKVALNLHKTH